MHLKRLELSGFKSFADRIQLDFGPGLNAVVGPNGSGKSNIADALRWALGEQSAKQLRGGKMEDVIFAGTAHRRPLGYAEITMRLDNSDGALPLEFKEITVTRRVYRSGESEFALNGEACRLKDIQMLFMDTGIGRDGYSIVGQGRIDEILSLRSEDRRLVFEDAAGISKFKARRGEALNKLERERQNRARVDDIIAELEEQLEPLSAQSEEARRYLGLREQYKNIHVNIFLGEIRKIGLELEQTEEALANGLAQSKDGKRMLTEARAAGEGLKAGAVGADVKFRRATELLLETTTAIEQKQSEAKLLESRASQLETDKTRLAGEVEKRDLGLAVRAEEGANVRGRKAAVQKELEELELQFSEQLERTAQREGAMKEGAAALDAHNQAIMTAMNAVTDARAVVLEAESNYARLEDEKERLNGEILRHETNFDEQKAARRQTEENLKSCSAELARAEASEEAYAGAFGQLKAEAKELEEILRRDRENLTASRGRYRALSELEAQREGYQRSVKAVLNKKAADPRFSGIYGAVGEMIGVKSEYETAIEIALGGAAQNIITQTEDDAKLAIGFLKNSREGRATFLPVSAVKGRTIDTERVKNEPGFIGIASQLVTSEPVYVQVLAQLLGDIIIIDTLDNALALHKKYNYSYKIVTKGGERLSPGGAITGGSINRQTAGIIGRRRQLADLKERIETLEENLAELTEQERQLGQKRVATQEALDRAHEKTGFLRFEEQNLRGQLAKNEETLKSLEQAARNYNEENDKLMSRLIEANGTVRAAKAELADKEEASAKARAALDEYHRQIEQSRREHTEEAGTLTELRVEISRRTEWVSQADNDISRLKREENIFAEERRLILAEIKANEDEAKRAAASGAAIADELDRLRNRLEEIRAELSASESEKTVLESAIAQAEADERVHSDSAALLEREIARLEMRKEHLDAASHRLHNEIWEEYGLTHQNALAYKRADISETALRRESQRLKAELSEMTNVNIGAIEAHKQLKTRYNFLTAQREDILGAEAALDELIQNLTSQMESRFTEKFAVIAKHFEDVFREMFSGGKAGLRLVDTENVLESGIEITAQPPGKALQNLMLLSGGERALTAIALLFAILRMKPSPFCVLDEIESALDDANVARFAKFIKQYTAGTQFILITHRKGTMEAADNLYGVTMEEQGVSKLVSVRLV